MDNAESFNFRYTFIHVDFDISNIIVNHKTFKLIGIVDFEDARIYDPAADFLFYDEGDDFLKALISNCQGDIDMSFEERMKFLYGQSCIGYIEFGIESNLTEMIEAGFQLLKRKIVKFPLK